MPHTETSNAALIASLRGVCAADDEILDIKRASRIEGIRRRLANASPGPWYVHATQDFVRVLCSTSSHTVNKIASVLRSDRRQGADAALIAHAPADLAWLADETDRLRAERNLLLEHADDSTLTAYWTLRAQGRQDEIKAAR